MPSRLPPHTSVTKAGPLPIPRVLPAGKVLWTPRTPSRLPVLSPSAYRPGLCRTSAAGEGLSCSVSGCRRMLSSIPRGCPASIRCSDAVCCLRRDMIGSATPPFGYISHEAARFASCWAYGFASRPGAVQLPSGFRRSARPSGFRPRDGACYAALRRLPRRDFHPQVRHSVNRRRSIRQDAPSVDSTRRSDPEEPR